MLQLVSTLDENGQVVAKGTKVQRGYYADNGPPTTVSGNGRDLSLAYQVRPYGSLAERAALDEKATAALQTPERS